MKNSSETLTTTIANPNISSPNLPATSPRKPKAKKLGLHFGKTWEKRWFLTVSLLNLLLVLLGLFAYLLLIPQVVQATLNDLGKQLDQRVTLKEAKLGEFGGDSLGVGVGLLLSPFLPFPIKAGLGITPVFVTDQDGNVIANTIVPNLEFWVNNPINLDVTTKVTFDGRSRTNLKKLLGQLSKGVPDLQIIVNLKVCA